MTRPAFWLWTVSASWLRSMELPQSRMSVEDFGPRISNAEEALTMVSNGGGKVVQSGRDILNVVPGWLEEPDTAARAGRSARLTVDTQIGATDRSAAMIVDIINQRR